MKKLQEPNDWIYPVLAIDPGVVNFSWAISEGGIVKYAQYISGMGTYRTCFNRLPKAYEKRLEAGTIWEPERKYAHMIVCVEMPKIYDTRRTGGRKVKKVNPNDIVHLAASGFHTAAWLAPRLAHSWTIIPVEPFQWKGQLPKEVTQARVNHSDRVSEADMQNWFRTVTPSKQHNVYDAIGINLWLTKRGSLPGNPAWKTGFKVDYKPKDVVGAKAPVEVEK